MYKYDTHVHTSESSACASMSGAKQARLYKELGYTGIIITDHFFNGNSSVPRNLPWEERIERFVLGYEHALEEGEKIGISVLFGWEESFCGTDFLVYGLDKQWLLKNPDILNWDIPEHFRRIQEEGGLFVHAHPFRIADYISEIRLFPEYEDAIEIMNAGNQLPIYNQKAVEYANKYNKPITGGSDAHHANSIHIGMNFDYVLKDIHDFIQCVKMRKNYTIIPMEESI